MRPLPVNWGILGCARVARQRWIPAINASGRGRVAGIASRTLEKAQTWAKDLQIERAYGSYEQLLDDAEIQAVYIGLPNHLHVPWVLKVLQAGKHVLCDKPLALRPQEVIQVVEAVAEHQRLLVEGFMYQYHRQYELIDRWLKEGRIGDLKMIRLGFCFYFDRPGDYRYDPEMGGGALLDLGCYCVHLARKLAGRKPIRVQGVQRLHETGADWTTSAILEFDDDILAIIDCSFGYQADQYLHIAGTDAYIASDYPFTPDHPTTVKLTSKTDILVETFPPDTPFTRCVDDFHRRLDLGEFLPCPAADAHDNLQTLQAIVQSATQGRPVELPG